MDSNPRLSARLKSLLCTIVRNIRGTTSFSVPRSWMTSRQRSRRSTRKLVKTMMRNLEDINRWKSSSITSCVQPTRQSPALSFFSNPASVHSRTWHFRETVIGSLTARTVRQWRLRLKLQRPHLSNCLQRLTSPCKRLQCPKGGTILASFCPIIRHRFRPYLRHRFRHTGSTEGCQIRSLPLRHICRLPRATWPSKLAQARILRTARSWGLLRQGTSRTMGRTLAGCTRASPTSLAIRGVITKAR